MFRINCSDIKEGDSLVAVWVSKYTSEKRATQVFFNKGEFWEFDGVVHYRFGLSDDTEVTFYLLERKPV